MIEIRTMARRAGMRVTLIDHIHAQDFLATVIPAAQRLCVQYDRIEFLVLDVRRFAGWSGAGTFAAQIRFLRTFGRNVERVAILGPRAWHGALPAVAGLFVAAEVRNFMPGQGLQLRRWLRAPRRH